MKTGILLFALFFLAAVCAPQRVSAAEVTDTTFMNRLAQVYGEKAVRDCLSGKIAKNDPLACEKQMARIAVLACTNGKDAADFTKIKPTDTACGESLRDYTRDVARFCKENPATQRGETKYTVTHVADADVLLVDRTDAATGNHVIIVFSNGNTTVPVHGFGGVDTDAWRPEFIKLK